jgi:hypothetical protein
LGKVKRAGDLLSSIFTEQFEPRSLEKGRVSANLFSTWTAIVAETKIPAAGDHSRIRDLEHGILVIEAEHPGWVQLLQTKQAQLLRMVQKRYPELEIRGVSFCLSRESISRPSTIPVASSRETMLLEPGIAASGPAPEQYPERDEALYESMKKFKKTIQKRNKNGG